MHLNYVSIWIANGWKTGYGESLSWSPIWEKKEFPTQKSTPCDIADGLPSVYGELGQWGVSYLSFVLHTFKD